MTADDQALLEAWRAGDEHAGRELVERHLPAVYRFFANKLGRDVDDLVQQTFLALVEGRERVREAAGFRGFLFGIARNKLLRHFRDRDPQPAEHSVAELAASGTSVAEGLAKKSEQRILLQALRRIPLDLQIALELAYWEGLSDREVAAILEVPVGTLKSRLRKARTLLDQAMAELAGSPELLRSTTRGLDGWVADLREQLEEVARPAGAGRRG
ncbi:MAG TPA: sigma-70 family RNA polymerase sigma factor [Nannocystaceae bacterium]|nr:sigma-70 family RNA polymerase sigma factor [Nannocystaceae bacterium]